MKKIVLITGLVAGLFFGANAQENEFQPSGKAFVKVFSNFNTEVTNGVSQSAFEVSRAYFGYEYKMSEHFSGKMNLDVGDPGVGKLPMTAYLKNAYVNYKNGNFSAKMGLIGTNSFGILEKLWGNRYVEKSFQDKNKFNSSADLGIGLAYKLSDWVSADLMFVNGEGYKKLQADNSFKTGVGVTVKPVADFIIRAYYDFMGNDNDVTQTTISGAVGYKGSDLTAGVEYNLQQNVKNTADKTMSGISAYANYSIGDQSKVFGRFDALKDDNNLIIAGLEYAPVKGLKLSPNFRFKSPADGSAVTTSYFLNCEIKF